MKRQVLFILLIGALLCFIAGPTPTHAADVYCPPVQVPANGICDCAVYNYGPEADTGVVIEMYDARGASRVITNNIPPQSSLYSSLPAPPGHLNFATTIACKVTGIGAHARVSLQCYMHFSDPTVYATTYALAVCSEIQFTPPGQQKK
jgi:hypothetical protein